MLFKGKSSKSNPRRILKYITNPKKVSIVSSENLSDKRDYAKQFEETAKLWNKNRSTNRRYYHFILSAPKGVSCAEEVHRMAIKMVEEIAQGHEVVVASHVDTEHIHSHIVVNATSLNNGRQLRYTMNDYRRYKDLANELGRELNLKEVDWRKKKECRKKISDSEKHMKKRIGDNSFARDNKKEYIRKAIDDARYKCKSKEDFIFLLREKGITCPRDTSKTISYKYDGLTVRGSKLGERYTVEEINKKLNENINKMHMR